MTQLFWPFSPSPSKKAAPAVGKASASQLSSAAKSSEHGTASNMDVKAVRQAQEVMRKLVMEDKKAARKRAEETVIHSHDLDRGALSPTHVFLSTLRIWWPSTLRKQN